MLVQAAVIGAHISNFHMVLLYIMFYHASSDKDRRWLRANSKDGNHFRILK